MRRGSVWIEALLLGLIAASADARGDDGHSGGTSAKSTDSTPVCTCTCADGPQAAACTQCTDSGGSCAGNFKDSCWYKLINGGCAAARVQNGVYQTLADCCAKWVSAPFNATPSNSMTVNGIVYYKNFATDTLDPYVPTLSPQLPFPGLGVTSYDNTTCAGRCCRLATLIAEPAHTPGCADDWSRCVSAPVEGAPMCTNATSGCLVWVPCDPNSRRDFWTAWGAFAGLGLFPVAVWLADAYVFDDAPSSDAYPVSAVWLCVVPHAVLTTLSLLIVSDYSQWKASTEVSMAYASYQGCVDYCNSAVDDPNTIMYRFCAENYTAIGQYAIWPADINPFRLSDDGCPPRVKQDPTSAYCASCSAHETAWVDLDQAMRFMLYQAYIPWPIALVAFYAVFFKNWCIHHGIGSHAVHGACFLIGQAACYILTAAHFILFVAACYFTSELTNQFVAAQLNPHFSPLSVTSMCGAWVAFDLMSVAVFVAAARCDQWPAGSTQVNSISLNNRGLSTARWAPTRLSPPGSTKPRYFILDNPERTI